MSLLVGYADGRFTVTLGSYSVKSNYFNTIFNLLRTLSLKIIIKIDLTIQLLSIVIRKRGEEGDARHHCTGITLRMKDER